jgi:hypothetical protein
MSIVHDELDFVVETETTGAAWVLASGDGDSVSYLESSYSVSQAIM